MAKKTPPKKTETTAAKQAAPEASIKAASDVKGDIKKVAANADKLAATFATANEAIQAVIFGQQKVIQYTLVTLLSGGHCLLIGVPGLAKTKLVDTIATVMGLHRGRIQCTPDLMPADILGSEVLETDKDNKRVFRFIKGPVFCQLLMADEINRASPRTQSALLQAMQEHQVSIAGQYHDLPAPFHVLATQNPLEQEGTYPLPEAQLDRFMLQINVDYPSEKAERAILANTTGEDEIMPKPVLSADELIAGQHLVRQMPVTEEITNAILTLVRAGRPESTSLDFIAKHINWGPGPRASQALSLAIRAKALLEGRLAPSIADVYALALPVLRHRMSLNFAARAEGIKIDDIIKEMTRLIE